MGDVASELLARALAEPAGAGQPIPLRWVSRDLGRPKVDLEDKQALHALLDNRP